MKPQHLGGGGVSLSFKNTSFLKEYLHALPIFTKYFLQMFIVRYSFPANEPNLKVPPTLGNKFIRKKTGLFFNYSGGTDSVMILQLLLY